MRVISGKAKGRQFAVPASARPTTDRVREAVFSIVASWAGRTDADPQLAGLAFLDLFAGSGAVALEAASRGAEAWAVESDPGAVAVLHKNAAKLGLAVHVQRQKVESFLTRPRAQLFDVAWLDPPYALPAAALESALASLEPWVAPGGLVIVERSGRSPDFSYPVAFTPYDRRDYGETAVYFANKGLQ
ncbi:MAG: RsmD family RNA methyltransferase [Propionibacteriaceae bacterium]|jgi:16S rRNA (guanine966-N2)-methyltransferase|nr:RsmD family RNA methyltransferase [Propionibacteriaceae bacterium]